MKELSIEQKAKAYDEAKSRISRAYNSNRCTIGFMNEIFPEFEESEDERIRGEMISYFKQINYDNAHTWNGINLNKFVAWLEKQSEQKHDKVEPKFNIGDTIINKTTKEQFTINGRSLALQYYHDEDHLHEVRFTEQDDWEIYEPIKQNSTKWGEEDKEIFGYLEDIVNFCYCNQYVVNVQTCEKVRQLVFRLKSSCFQSGWSKDDITRINEIIETLNIVQANRVRTQRMHYNKATIDKNIDWLKSLKDRVQPKQEWSEEDEKMWKSALWHVKNSCGNGGKNSGEFEVYNWLKSIKNYLNKVV